MSVFFRPLNSNNVFHFFEDKNLPNNIKTISYELGADNSVVGKWEKKGTISQLMGAIKSVSDGKAEILSKSDLEAIFSVST
ncbi:MAG: hypothetical protein P8H55_00110 [Hellea sp.]|nr:hypothetical protein [Hellea sp.]MDG2361664.1 hypothetical protein [Hellea sp.]